MKTKVSELTREKLAEWTARAQWWIFSQYGDNVPYRVHSSLGYIGNVDEYRPDINAAQAMDLLLHFKFIAGFLYEENDGTPIYFCQFGRFADDREISENLNVAICRAVVASVYGEYVEEDA